MLDVMTRRNAPQIAQDRRDALVNGFGFLAGLLALCAIIGALIFFHNNVVPAFYEAANYIPKL